MREIVSGNPNTQIVVTDEPGEGGANHCYEINIKLSDGTSPSVLHEAGGHIRFQKGPVRTNGVNGCHQEDLLAIVIDRLESFQAGPFQCRDNALALTKCQEALHWLDHRTRARQLRGVEGTNTL